MPKMYQMYIDGEWVDADGGGTFEDYNPYTGEVFATVASGTRADAQRAIESAAAAFPSWAATAPAERRALFLRAADILEQRGSDISTILIEESGATVGWSMFQLHFVAGLLREAAAQAYSVTGEIIPADLPGAFFMGLRQPVGVVVGIAPWNAPLILGTRAIAMPLAYGNTVVLKPSEEAPLSAGLVIAEVLAAAGFPKGVVNVLTHAPSAAVEVGDELIVHPKVRRINFTGSTHIGRIIAEKAGRHLKRVLLELGGKAPLIVLRDADLDYAVQATAFGAFMHQGQICMSAERIIVERPIAEAFMAGLARKVQSLKVGDPRNPETAIGPLINRRAIERVHGLVGDALEHGAQLLAGGKADGPCYQPTLLSDVTPDMRVYAEETFGPIAPVIVVDDIEEALRIANDTAYGLSSGILTRDFTRGLALAERLETGMVHINDQSVHDEPQVPFGGVKESGWGRFGGRAALEEFTELRWITMQRTPRSFPI
jgi:acyl-CoA reductase-like NAD-dependent aldehyde dehydrogenase